MRSRVAPAEEASADGLYYDAPDEEAAPLPPPRYFYFKRLLAACMVAAMVVVAWRHRNADEEPPPPPRITKTTIDTDGLPHPHEWAPPQKRLVHYIDLTRPPTPHPLAAISFARAVLEGIGTADVRFRNSGTCSMGVLPWLMSI